jgi:DNA polymerase III sliding clamp (beta) subunit (PCNA family)
MAALREKVTKLVGKKQPANVKAIIHLPSLEAAFACASKDNTRKYLKGVYLAWEEGVTRCVATDGHRMCVAEPTPSMVGPVMISLKVKPELHQSVIVSDADVKEILKWREKSALAVTEYASAEFLPDGKVVFSTCDQRKTLQCKPVDATYPDYKRVIPKKRSQEVNGSVNFNGQYLADLMKVAKAGYLNSRIAKVSVELNAANEPAVFRFENVSGAKAFVVLMPMRA